MTHPGVGSEAAWAAPPPPTHHIISQIAHFLKVIKSETGFLAAAPGGKMAAKSHNEDEFHDLIPHGKHTPLNGI